MALNPRTLTTAFNPGGASGLNFSGALSAAGGAASLFQLGFSLFQSSEASAARERQLRREAEGFQFGADTLRIEKEQERIKGKLSVVLAEDILADAQAANLVSSAARGVGFTGSAARLQEGLVQDADFFRAMTLYTTNITVLGLERAALFEEKQAGDLIAEANREANKFFGLF